MKDCIIVGLGCAGISSLRELSKRGKDVVGLDMFGVPNGRGSSHGDTRIIRLSYYEGSNYVPLLKRAKRKWLELEKYSGEKLLYETGSIFISDRENEDNLRKCIKSCQENNLKYETGGCSELDFGLWDLPSDTRYCYQPGGGVLRSRKCIETQKNIALDNGASIVNEKVVNINSMNDHVKLETRNKKLKAEKVVLSMGPWLQEYYENVQIERHTVNEYHCGSFSPAWIAYLGNDHYYGLSSEESFKIGKIGEDKEVSSVENMKEAVSLEDVEDINKFIEHYTTENMRLCNSNFCPLTRSEDDNYLIDWHPDLDNVIVCGGLSGHGFKLSNLIGDIVADMIDGIENEYNLEEFRIQ